MTGDRTVTLIGLGRMGGAMARTLRRRGHDLVLWNRDPAKAVAIADEIGAELAASPAAAAAAGSFVLTSLADDAALEAVYLRDDGVAAGLAPGTVVVDTSTVDPSTVLEIGAAVDATGAGFLDAPVSGSVSTVEAGALTIMVGGDPELLERARPILAGLATTVVHVGPRGAGAATKLAVNGLVHGLNVALSEAVVLAERAGVDRAKAYEVFASGAGGAPFVTTSVRRICSPRRADVAFSLDLVEKDLALITGLGRRVGAPMAQAEVGLDIVRRAVEAGLGDRDLSAIAVLLRREAPDREGVHDE
jgi:3-hydroxyisobutyrate dehydrogenase-like beta-hydroxyacid dehydrogenase